MTIKAYKRKEKRARERAHKKKDSFITVCFIKGGYHGIDKNGKIYFHIIHILIIIDKAQTISWWLYLYLQVDNFADQVH